MKKLLPRKIKIFYHVDLRFSRFRSQWFTNFPGYSEERMGDWCEDEDRFLNASGRTEIMSSRKFPPVVGVSARPIERAVGYWKICVTGKSLDRMQARRYGQSFVHDSATRNRRSRFGEKNERLRIQNSEYFRYHDPVVTIWKTRETERRDWEIYFIVKYDYYKPLIL